MDHPLLVSLFDTLTTRILNLCCSHPRRCPCIPFLLILMRSPDTNRCGKNAHTVDVGCHEPGYAKDDPINPTSCVYDCTDGSISRECVEYSCVVYFCYIDFGCGFVFSSPYRSCVVHCHVVFASCHSQKPACCIAVLSKLALVECCYRWRLYGDDDP